MGYRERRRLRDCRENPDVSMTSFKSIRERSAQASSGALAGSGVGRASRTRRRFVHNAHIGLAEDRAEVHDVPDASPGDHRGDAEGAQLAVLAVDHTGVRQLVVADVVVTDPWRDPVSVARRSADRHELRVRRVAAEEGMRSDDVERVIVNEAPRSNRSLLRGIAFSCTYAPLGKKAGSAVPTEFCSMPLHSEAISSLNVALCDEGKALVCGSDPWALDARARRALAGCR